MLPPLFDLVAREALEPKGHEESSFEFFNRVKGEYWQAVRNRVQEWADVLTQEDYREFRARFRSGDDFQFNSAYLELYLHESLRRAGYAITVHPATNSGRRPDFHASRADGAFYLEAIAPARSPVQQAKSARVAGLFRAVDGTGDPNWWLWLEEVEEGNGSPRASKLRSDIRRWLSSLVPASPSDISSRPRFQWADRGWKVTLTAIARPESRRGSPPQRSIGVYPATGGFIDDSSTIKRALTQKHSAYGALDAPLVVAVGVYNFDRDHWATANALWGHEAIQLAVDDADDQGTLIRQPDGYFGVPGAWRHSNVAGVLIVNQLQPTHFPIAQVSLWLHPEPARPLPVDIGLPVEVIALERGKLVTRRPQIDPHQFFDVPEAWPPGEAFPRDN